MKVGWKKRALAYSVVVMMAAGLIYLLSATPLEVQVQVDLTGARNLGSAALTELTLRFPAGDGEDGQVTRFSFPASVFPSGPPAMTTPVMVKLAKGVHEVTLDFVYGTGPGAVSGSRKASVQVERDAPLTLKLGN